MCPKISVITINLNDASGLRKTIKSVIDQDFSNFEYIVIDGGSTDDSMEVIKHYADKIAYWESEPDNGIYYAMNKGIIKATGEWIGFINSGDWYESNALSIINDAIISDQNAQIVHGVLRIWDKDLIYKIQGVHSSFLPSGMIEHPTCFVKKEVYNTIGAFDTNYKLAADYEFMVRAHIKNCKFLFIDKIIANYLLGGLSCTSLLSGIETHQIRQKYGFTQKVEEEKEKRIFQAYNTFKHLVVLLMPACILRLYRFLRVNLCWLKDFILNIDQILNPKKIPIIINNFNRLTYLNRLITSLEKRGYKNIYIIDNASTYAPLLEYYRTTPYKVFFLNENKGHKAFWESDVKDTFKSRFYVYTDPDLEIVDECPNDFMKIFLKILWKSKYSQVVGFSLKIDDLPDCYKYKQDVIKWEMQFYEKKEGNLFRAPIDTTFALHRPNVIGSRHSDMMTFRTSFPYQMRHLPWYEDSSNLSEEDVFYTVNKKKTIGHWSSLV